MIALHENLKNENFKNKSFKNNDARSGHLEHEKIKNDDYTLDTKKNIRSSANLPKVKSAALALG